MLRHENALLQIDTKALRENYKAISSFAIGKQVAAVVKADAYGLGIKEISLSLAREGCNTFFVATLDEALQLRSILPDEKILVLNGLLIGAEEEYINNHLFPIINQENQLFSWLQICKKFPESVSNCALHIDTGMNRLGIPWQNFCDTNADALIAGVEAIKPSILLSHYSCADEPNNELNALQAKRFARAINKLPKAEKTAISMANSAGVLHNLLDYEQLCRPGVALYGVNPCDDIKPPVKINSVVKLTSRVLAIQNLDTNETYGYGATWQPSCPSKIAILGVGYADGIHRSLSRASSKANQDNFRVFFQEASAPIVGRISMDSLAVDITHLRDRINIGDIAEIIGDNATIEDMARNADTIGYEVLTGLRGRVRREYLNL